MSGAGGAPAPAGGGGLAGAKAFVGKNKVVLGLGGAAAVAGLALVQSKGKGSASSGSPTIAGNGAATGAGGVYDSSSSDTYNALQPMLERTSNQYETLLDWLKANGVGGGSSPIPVPGAGKPGTSDPTTAAPAPRPGSTAVSWSPTFDESKGTPSNWSTDAQSVANRDTARADTSQSWSNGFLGVNPVIDWSKFSTSSSSTSMSASEAAQRERDKAAGW